MLPPPPPYPWHLRTFYFYGYQSRQFIVPDNYFALSDNQKTKQQMSSEH